MLSGVSGPVKLGAVDWEIGVGSAALGQKAAKSPPAKATATSVATIAQVHVLDRSPRFIRAMVFPHVLLVWLDEEAEDQSSSGADDQANDG